jgi:ATP-independent RNA helicase DbpA
MKFNQLNIPKDMVNNLLSLKFEDMTDIQEKSLPIVLNGDDIIAKAKTGSGKTLSFGLGVLNNLDEKNYRIQSMILAPTRELANQIATTLKSLARYRHNIKILTLCGGVPYKPQVHSLSHQAHIIVGTAGRVLKHLKEDNFSCEFINTLVLDEADRMLDMGFSEDINEIISYLPKKRQTMLFSATFTGDIESLANNIMQSYQFIETKSQKNRIEEVFYDIVKDKKAYLIPKLFNKEISKVIIFCNTKIDCDKLADTLSCSYELEVLVLHSNLEQKDREETLVLFENGSYPILIATDLASRGLDVDDVDLVINYDLPNSEEIYVHRIGRTARNQNSGKSISLVDDENSFERLQDYMDTKYTLNSVDEIFKKDDGHIEYEYSTLYINGGKKDKVRAGDILGALTAGIGLEKNDIGKINIFPKCSYVAIKNQSFEKAYNGLSNNRIKNRYFKIYKR